MELRGGSTGHKDSRKAPKGGAPVPVEKSEHVCGTERETMLQGSWDGRGIREKRDDC